MVSYMKFQRFHDRLTVSALSVLVVCLIGMIGWFAKVLSGSGLTDADMIVGLFAAATSVITIVLWVICTGINAFFQRKLRRCL